MSYRYDYLPSSEPVSKYEYKFDECPACGKPDHFFWNVKKNKGHCKSGGCGLKVMSLDKLKDLLDGTASAYVPRWISTTQEDAKEPLRYKYKWTTNAWDFPSSRAYLMRRGVSESIARKAPIYYVESRDALCILANPIDSFLDPEVTLYRGVKGYPSKFISPDGCKMGRYGYGLSHISQDTRAVVVVEGAFDLLSTGLLGLGIALLGTSFDKNWIAFFKARFDYVVLWFDNDLAGDKARTKMIPMLEAWGIRYKDVTYKKNSDGSTQGYNCEPGDLRASSPRIVSLKKHLLTANFKLRLNRYENTFPSTV
ncbi:MAG: toprim domain-containing protein [Candidatus Riesia sp.]|nr:toprim domain-containing protein [Candidatus Riesia sp.]